MAVLIRPSPSQQGSACRARTAGAGGRAAPGPYCQGGWCTLAANSRERSAKPMPVPADKAIQLVNAAHVKHVPGRKTDTIDAVWLRHPGFCGGWVIPRGRSCGG